MFVKTETYKVNDIDISSQIDNNIYWPRINSFYLASDDACLGFNNQIVKLAIYKDFLNLANKQHHFVCTYLQNYKLLGYIMNGIKWMLMGNVFHSTFLECNTFWHLLTDDIKDMPNNMQGKILQAIYESSNTDAIILILRYNDGL